MAVDVASADRAAAADRREAARAAALQHTLQQAYARRDQRIEEARDVAAARPTPADRAAEAPRRTQSASRVLDVLA
jgi:hypothetical protein